MTQKLNDIFLENYKEYNSENELYLQSQEAVGFDKEELEEFFENNKDFLDQLPGDDILNIIICDSEDNTVQVVCMNQYGNDIILGYFLVISEDGDLLFSKDIRGTNWEE